MFAPSENDNREQKTTNLNRAFFSVSDCATHICPNTDNRNVHFSTLKNGKITVTGHKVVACQTWLVTTEIFAVIQEGGRAKKLLSLH